MVPPRSRRRTCHSYVDFDASARKHGIADDDAGHALVAAEDDGGKCLYSVPTAPGTCSKSLSVLREDGGEVVIHAMRMCRIYESWFRDVGEAGD